MVAGGSPAVVVAVEVGVGSPVVAVEAGDEVEAGDSAAGTAEVAVEATAGDRFCWLFTRCRDIERLGIGLE